MTAADSASMEKSEDESAQTVHTNYQRCIQYRADRMSPVAVWQTGQSEPGGVGEKDGPQAPATRFFLSAICNALQMSLFAQIHGYTLTCIDLE